MGVNVVLDIRQKCAAFCGKLRNILANSAHKLLLVPDALMMELDLLKLAFTL